jgi:hypothetical protein
MKILRISLVMSSQNCNPYNIPIQETKKMSTFMIKFEK